MEIVMWDVDTQVDFVDPDGRLAVDGAEAIRDNLARITDHARERSLPVWGSVDYHAPDDPELAGDPDFESTFPPHCLRDTDGWRKIPETAPRNPLWIDSEPLDREELTETIRNHDGEIYFRKQAFDAFTNPNLEPALSERNPFGLVVYGVTLDVCVRHAVQGLLERGYQVTVVEDATRAIDPSRRDGLLFDWKNFGVQVLGTEELLSGYVV